MYRLMQVMVRMHVSCIIHQMSNCTASRVYPIQEQTTEAMNTASEM